MLSEFQNLLLAFHLRFFYCLTQLAASCVLLSLLMDITCRWISVIKIMYLPHVFQITQKFKQLKKNSKIKKFWNFEYFLSKRKAYQTSRNQNIYHKKPYMEIWFGNFQFSCQNAKRLRVRGFTTRNPIWKSGSKISENTHHLVDPGSRPPDHRTSQPSLTYPI